MIYTAIEFYEGELGHQNWLLTSDSKNEILDEIKEDFLIQNLPVYFMDDPEDVKAYMKTDDDYLHHIRVFATKNTYQSKAKEFRKEFDNLINIILDELGIVKFVKWLSRKLN